MKLTEHSKNRLMNSLNHWRVPRDFAEPMYNYLVHGFEPGGFFKGWYANDATSIIRSHPANTVEALKNLTKWMLNCLPPDAWGSHAAVDTWINMPEVQRRYLLEQRELIYTEQDEIMLALKGLPVTGPIVYD